MSTIVNLVPNPSFEQTAPGSRGRSDFELPYEEGGLYTHVHNTARASTAWCAGGRQSVFVKGTSRSNDTHIAPGGRNEEGTFRLGMRPGETYTAQVTVHLEERLRGALHKDALTIALGCVMGGRTDWRVAVSEPAPNRPGSRQLTLTFTVPAEATAAWIRLVCGMSAGAGGVHWDDVMLTQSPGALPYFDGDTPEDACFTYGWTGARQLSPSTRTLKDPDLLLRDPGTREPLDEEQLQDVCRLLAEAGTAEELALVSEHIRRLPTLTEETARPLTAMLGEAQERMERRRARVSASAGLDRVPEHHVQKARALLDERRWRSAAAAYERAVALAPEDAQLRYELAEAYDRVRDDASSLRVCREAVALDAPLPFDALAALETYPRAFRARRTTGLFVAERLAEIRRRADAAPGGEGSVGDPLPVFSYWAQGRAAAPPLVQRCLARIEEAAEGSAHVLSDADLPYYVSIPRNIEAAVGANKTYFSDILRVELLHRYGGAWLDSTCWLGTAAAPFLDRCLTAGFTAPSYTGPRISSWFMAARPGSRIVALLRSALHLWWEERPHLPHYYHLHHVFEMLYRLDEEFQQSWDAAYAPSSQAAHAFHARLLEPRSGVDVEAILRRSPVQKLRYKYDPAAVTPDLLVAHLVRGEASLVLR
jgi:hypothetical protein